VATPAYWNGPADALATMAHDIEQRLLVLRTMAAVRAFLDDYPIAPAQSADTALLNLTEWLNEGDDCDEERFRLAVRLGYPAVRLDRYDDRGHSGVITPALARRLRAVPMQKTKGLVAVAMEDCENPDALQQLNFLMRDRVVPMITTAQAMRDLIANYYDHDEDLAIVQQLGLDPTRESSDRDAERLSHEKPVVRIIAELIQDAVVRRASDIHIRPGPKGADVLYRIDDELVPIRRFLRSLLPALVSRVKVLAEMNLAEHRKPQDGRTSVTLNDGRKVDMRVSVMPAIFGESVVIRLLDTMESLRGIDQLGLSPADRTRLDDVMARSHGMFLTTGPTGCGKSTTLYAMLLELRKLRINILTIEDPVEYHIEDIQQMQVNRAADFGFASAMRNFLRHDPDVIMVGEMRDRETAAVGVESALTGHLLLSTLHTNTAAATITRLLDLGIEAYLLRASLLAVMAQRLARLTCLHCREVEQIAGHVRETLGVAPDEVFYVGRGCSHCEGLGVKKRRAIYELMVVTPAIQKLIVPGADADRIHRTAMAEGMTPLTQAAVQLARSGAISLMEAWRLRAD
jgi:type IV pilus assembly protein PilB